MTSQDRRSGDSLDQRDHDPDALHSQIADSLEFNSDIGITEHPNLSTSSLDQLERTGLESDHCLAKQMEFNAHHETAHYNDAHTSKKALLVACSYAEEGFHCSTGRLEDLEKFKGLLIGMCFHLVVSTTIIINLLRQSTISFIRKTSSYCPTDRTATTYPQEITSCAYKLLQSINAKIYSFQTNAIKKLVDGAQAGDSLIFHCKPVCFLCLRAVK